MRSALAILTMLAATASAVAQPRRPPIADPYHAFRVEGRVLFADGQAAAGVVVERAISASDLRPYASGYEQRTDASGAFVIEHAGLGPSTGRDWTLVVRRDGCAPGVVSITLQGGRLRDREAIVASGVVLRLPACASDPAPIPDEQPGTS